MYLKGKRVSREVKTSPEPQRESTEVYITM